MDKARREWYTWEFEDEAEAKELFEWYESREHPVALFQDRYTDYWLLAAKADENTHILAGQEVHYNSLVAGHRGTPKLAECLMCHELVQVNMLGRRDWRVAFR